MNKNFHVIFVFVAFCIQPFGQHVQLTRQQIINLTSEWKGEQTADGRPKVSDQVLEELKNVAIEEAWGLLRNKGYQNQFEGDWMILYPDSVMTGRVVTAQYMPLRPDMDKMIKDTGKAEGRIGNTNSWPIDVLKDAGAGMAALFCGRSKMGSLL
jgi:hypothetical protein